MARHTLVTVTDTIFALRDQDVVYKTQVDDLKYDFSHAFEADENSIKEQYGHAGKWENLTPAEALVYNALPYEARHWYGKKFTDLLSSAPETAFIDAVRSHRNRWRPLFTALQELIARQVKGRRPPEPKNVIGTRIQMRATCACCFRDQAVNGDLMVSHGYTLDYGFQNGICSGFNRPHFGTEAGRDIAAETAKSLTAQADSLDYRAKKVLEGDPDVPVFSGLTPRIIENPTNTDRRNYAAKLSNSAYALRGHAKMLRRMVEEWKAHPAREVEVEITE